MGLLRKSGHRVRVFLLLDLRSESKVFRGLGVAARLKSVLGLAPHNWVPPALRRGIFPRTSQASEKSVFEREEPSFGVCPGRFSAGRLGCIGSGGLVFVVRRGAVAQGTVEALAVVEGFDVVKEGLPGLLPGGEAGAVNQFEFKGAPKGFHGGIVVAIGRAAHGGHGLRPRDGLAKFQTGVLDPAIGVKEQAWCRLAMAQGHVPSGLDQGGVNVLAHGPADDAAAVEVQQSGQIEPAFAGVNVGDVGDPGLIGPGGGRGLGQQIGRDGVGVPAVGGFDSEPGLWAAAELLLAHQAGDAVAAVLETVLTQLRLDARHPVSLAAGLMNLRDLRLQTLVFPSPGSGLLLAVAPVVKAAGGDLERLAQPADGMVHFHRLNALVALLGGSERIPKVFFRISRCWRKSSFSLRKTSTSASSWAAVGLAGTDGPGARTLFQR